LKCKKCGREVVFGSFLEGDGTLVFMCGTCTKEVGNLFKIASEIDNEDIKVI
jgi:DNA-directed RNA polymerase subunit RPC12/RpoP